MNIRTYDVGTQFGVVRQTQHDSGEPMRKPEPVNISHVAVEYAIEMVQRAERERDIYKADYEFFRALCVVSMLGAVVYAIIAAL